MTFSKENRRIDLLTITSHTNKLKTRENYKNSGIFPDKTTDRPFQFLAKKYIFLSARVHPGEIPGSHTFNGVLEFLLNETSPISQTLRDKFVFVLLPILNPDGVFRGHYRTDTQGLNLNRYYIKPNVGEHPVIFAAKEIIN